jgi:hypothetical protein
LMSQRRMIVSGLRHCRNASSICSRWGRLQTEHLRAWRSSGVRAGESSWSREGFGGEGRGLGWGRGLGLERDLDLGARFWRGGLPKLHFRIGYDFYNAYSGCHGASAGEASGALLELGEIRREAGLERRAVAGWGLGRLADGFRVLVARPGRARRRCGLHRGDFAGW